MNLLPFLKMIIYCPTGCWRFGHVWAISDGYYSQKMKLAWYLDTVGTFRDIWGCAGALDFTDGTYLMLTMKLSVLISGQTKTNITDTIS